MTPKPQTLTLSAFQASSEYRACRPKSQAWLTALVTNGFDYAAATAAAYPTCKTHEKARVVSYAVRNWPKIVAALNLYLGRTPLDVAKVQRQKTIKQLVREVRLQLKHAEPGSIAGQRLTSQLTSLLLGTKSEVEDDEPTAENSKPQPVLAGHSDVQIYPRSEPAIAPPLRFQVDEIVLQDSKTYRVTSVDADGQILTAEEMPTE